jgi:hypothetical protein
MTGFEYLQTLSSEQKEGIERKFENLDNLYQKIIELNSLEYNLTIQKPEGYKEKLQKIENQLYDIENKLDELGLEGKDVTTEIGCDFSEVIVTKKVQKLDEYLKTKGTDFKTMRDWIYKKFNL